MSDIFISYSSNDRLWVEQFAKTLEAYGWSVWWDRAISTGGSFNAEIRRELSAAKCAIVVWSEQSVEREWVQAEAAEAKKYDKYLPIKINECELPLGFTQRTYQSLVDWETGVEHAGFSQLLKDIERLVRSPPKGNEFGLKPLERRIHPFWFVSTPAIVAAAVAIGLELWPISARVHVDLTTERIEFVVGAKESQDSFTLAGMVADSVGIENFEMITVAPMKVEVADPSQYQFEEDAFPGNAWRILSITDSELALVSDHQARRPRVVLEGTSIDKRESIKLDSITVLAGARVSLETREKKRREKIERKEGITIKVVGQKEFIVSPGRQFTLIGDHMKIRGLKDLPFPQADELTYRITLPEQLPRITVKAQSDQLVLLPTFVLGGLANQVFGGLPVTTLDFTRQASEADGGQRTIVKAGARVSALTGEGMITFPDYPHLGTVLIEQDEAIGLEYLDGFIIQELSLMANGTDIHLTGNGMAKEIRTKTGQVPIHRHRLTMLDAFWHNARLAVFATIIATVFATSLGAYRLWKEFKR